MPERVVAVVRHREAVLCIREPRLSPLGLPSRPANGDPPAALDELLAALGLQGVSVERQARTEGSVVSLLSVDRRPGDASGATWEPPAALRRAGASADWTAYRSVAPTVESVAADRERGSTAIAIDALWALRDVATEAAMDGGGDLAAVESIAIQLLAARPAMAALGNRVNRAMAGAGMPQAVEAAASRGIERAAEADAVAAELAAETIAGARVLTLSRSGTVRRALLAARPSVVVLASRPGSEGLGVAEELAGAGLDASACPDAAVYDRLRTGDRDAVLVGADSVTPDGGVVNKVGTRALGLAAERAGVPCYVVCASDKIRPAAPDRDADPIAARPTEWRFDWTPPRLVTAVLTERGRLGPDDVGAVAADHRALASWRDSRSTDTT